MTRAGLLGMIAGAILLRSAVTVPQEPPDRAPDATISAAATDAAAQQALADRIDELLAAAWKSAGIAPAEPAPDAAWLRRVSLDLRGRPPSMNEVEAFLGDARPDKRARFIDVCLSDRGFAENQACIWTNLLLASAGKDARKAEDWLQPWLEAELHRRTAFADITRMLIADSDTAVTPGSVSFILGYRDAIDVLTAVTARAFLGLQIQCAQCHDHPFDRWKPADFNRLTGFFSELKSGHSPGEHLNPVMHVGDRDLDDDLRNRMRMHAGKLKGDAAPAEMEQASPARLEVDGGPAMQSETPPMRGAAARSSRPSEAAALNEVLQLIRRTPKGENPLQSFAAAPDKLAVLMSRLPPDAREDLQKYQVRRELYFEAAPLDGAIWQPAPGVTRREALALWIVGADNPWFAKAITNRLFSQLFGKGLVEPIDDLSGSKDVVLPELLDLLAAEFLKHGTELRHVAGALARTRAYALGNSLNPNAAERDRQERLYATHPVRAFTAEQALRALRIAIADPDADPYLGGAAAAASPSDRSVTIEKVAPAFAVDPASGECSASIPQSLFLMNSTFANTMTRERRAALLKPFLDATITPAARLRRLFLVTLHRPPTEVETAALSPMVDGATGGIEKGVENLVWALINSTEFHTNH